MALKCELTPEQRKLYDAAVAVWQVQAPSTDLAVISLFIHRSPYQSTVLSIPPACAALVSSPACESWQTE